MSLEKLLHDTRAFYCLQNCNVCYGKCPVSKAKPIFSHRYNLRNSMPDNAEELLKGSDLWSCLTCGRCSHGCPSAVKYLEFMRLARGEALKKGIEGIHSHNGIIKTMQEMQAFHLNGDRLNGNRLNWLNDTLEIEESGEYYYFTGCLPYFDIIYADIGVKSLQIAKSAVRLLNLLGIRPVLSNFEKCCGHDLYWAGDTETFLKLGKHNLDTIAKSGARKVIFSCAECYATFKKEYPRYFGALPFEMMHMAELFAMKRSLGKLHLGHFYGAMTYQDPCRLGRFLEIYEEPRLILKNIPGAEFIDMPNCRAASICCGPGGWINCSSHVKKMQYDRLKEAEKTGANFLVTACPKCEIHFKCAMHNQNADFQLEVKDLTLLLAETAIGSRQLAAI